MGKCVVVVKAENGKIAAAYNEDGFTSDFLRESPNLNGFIVSVSESGGCGDIFHRNDHSTGISNYPFLVARFGTGFDLLISNNCHQNTRSRSLLGCAYGRRSGVNRYALFGQDSFRVVDYEVFKIVIE
jgi:hypothetical protein